MVANIEITGAKAQHIIGNSAVYLMDCMEGMKQIPEGLEILGVIDPPYGLSPDSLNGRGKMKNRAILMDTSWDIAPSAEYFEELKRVSKNQIIWGGNYFPLPPSRCIICWDKVQPWENFSQVELAWTSFDSPAKLYRYDNRTGNKIHPTQKPVALYDWIYKNYAKPTDIILDTHLGSQSSRIAADRAGLPFIGFETDKEYFHAGNKRFKNHKSQLAIQF
jgi:site-specific DNA-methyltransferase (adenine-specific)